MPPIDKMLDKNTLITWNFLVVKHSEPEIEFAKEMTKDIVLMRTSFKDTILRPHKESIERDKDWIPDNSAYIAYDKNNSSTKKTMNTRKKPWLSISINHNGLFFPCCAVYEEKFNFYDTKKDSMRNIWNSQNLFWQRKRY